MLFYLLIYLLNVVLLILFTYLVIWKSLESVEVLVGLKIGPKLVVLPGPICRFFFWALGDSFLGETFGYVGSGKTKEIKTKRLKESLLNENLLNESFLK